VSASLRTNKSFPPSEADDFSPSCEVLGASDAADCPVCYGRRMEMVTGKGVRRGRRRGGRGVVPVDVQDGGGGWSRPRSTAGRPE